MAAAVSFVFWSDLADTSSSPFAEISLDTENSAALPWVPVSFGMVTCSPGVLFQKKPLLSVSLPLEFLDRKHNCLKHLQSFNT